MKKLYYQVKPSTDLSQLPAIRGHNFDEPLGLSDFLDAYARMGMQGSELSRAIDVIRTMRREGAIIFLSFTSNMISSGLRDIITWLVKHKHVDVLCTSGGGVEEDAIKAFGDFRLGTFHVSGESLFDKGVNRIGNIYVTNEQYSYAEMFMRKVFDALPGGASPSEICRCIGQTLELSECDFSSSYLYWAYKNNIPVYCPAIIDGAIGDFAYFYRKSHPFSIDTAKDHETLIDFVLQQEKTGAIVLGGGVSKHYVLNASIFREGVDYAVYVSTADFFDGSDSGGNQEEAITWAKIKVRALRAKVHCDATIAFPLIAYGGFMP